MRYIVEKKVDGSKFLVTWKGFEDGQEYSVELKFDGNTICPHTLGAIMHCIAEEVLDGLNFKGDNVAVIEAKA